MHKLSPRLAAPFTVALFLSLAACGGGGGDQGQQPPAKVNVAKVVAKQVTEWDEFTGRIVAVEEVEIRPRVQGYLREIHFEDGDVVEQGDKLFTIDQREYRAAVQLASADLESAEARAELAAAELERGIALREARALSAEELTRRESEQRQAAAALSRARAALDRSQLDLEFTVLRAPIRGRVGAALVDVGNLVTPSTTMLTTLVALDPVHVTFEGDERIYLKYQAQAASGERPSSRDEPNPVRVGLATDSDYPYSGTMDFVDNKVNPETGTIQGRAIVPNPDGYLIPGLFARVRLLGSGEHQALLIHDVAVLTDQDRKYVYVVTDDDKAERRDVRLGREIDGLRVITEGLTANDRVVVNGVRKIFFNGAPVVPTEVPMTEPMAEPAAQASNTD